ncbi:MAG: hypothetical protein WKF57_01515 [Nakamurella sp.]
MSFREQIGDWLGSILDLYDVAVRDEDGDFRFDIATSSFAVRVAEDASLVHITAVAVHDALPSLELYEELTSLTLTTPTCTLLWTENSVLIRIGLRGAGLDQSRLLYSIDEIARVADRYAPLVVSRFGGSLARPTGDVSELDW